MGEFKGTTGDIRRFNNRIEEWGQFHHNVICRVESGRHSSYDLDLIRDAFNVRQQINCDLPELLRQRNELHDALQAIVDNIENWIATGVPADSAASELLYKNAKNALAGVDIIKEATEL